MDDSKQKYLALTGFVSRYLESAAAPTMSRRVLLAVAGEDISLLEGCLSKWEAEARLVWRRKLEAAAPDDLVVCFGKYPQGDVLWPHPLPIENGEATILVDIYGDGRFAGVYPKRQLKFIKKYCPAAVFS